MNEAVGGIVVGKQIKERILHIENCSRNLNNLQNCIITNKMCGEGKSYIEAVNVIEDEAGLNVHLDVLCFNAIQLLEKEIRRLENIIDDVVVNEE